MSEIQEAEAMKNTKQNTGKVAANNDIMQALIAHLRILKPEEITLIYRLVRALTRK